MNATAWKTYFAGFAIYAACIGLAALPLFPKPLTVLAVTQLLSAAAVASALVAVLRISGLDRRLGDPGASFTQALLGVAICSGLYAAVCADPRPQVTFMSFLLWTAVVLMDLSPRKVGALFAVNLAIYMNAFSGSLFVSDNTERYVQSVFTLLMTAMMAAFMYWRAADYTRVRKEKAQLRDENAQQLEQLQEAEARIHTLTVQDMDTIALKYPYFKDALAQQKLRADKNGETFSIGLIEIDHLAALQARCGEAVAKQLVREFAERATKVIRRMDLLEEADDAYHPLGRVGEGLFGLILPGTNLKGAQHCAERLHTALEFRDVHTNAGPVTLTLTIAVTEYAAGEEVDEILQQLSMELERARMRHEDIYTKVNKPQKVDVPLKGARGSHEMQLLDYKDYHRPVH
ncbi:MAG TPA: GGDEF domain-containing protein [Gammaproteobacteria bacterium]|nr:GGDEF domain-containing protein [Gammaproteobacteria bacterium]